MSHIVKQIVSLSVSLVLIIIGTILTKLNIIAEKEVITLLIFGAAFIIGGYYTFLEGIEHTLENKALNVDLLMILAAIGAFYIGDYGEGAILIFIFGVSHILEDYAMLKSKKSFTNLLSLAPSKANIIKDNQEEQVLVETLVIGDKVSIKMGEQIPVDGIIIEGSTSIDEKVITGEFEFKDKTVGDTVYAGTINMSSQIIVEVGKDAKETVVQKIIDFVAEAQTTKTNSQRFIDQFEKWYVYAVIALALIIIFISPLVGIWEKVEALNKGIVVLVVASPCAVVASITPAILASLSRCSKEGVLVKGGAPFEYLRKMDIAVFDKTGTITEGAPKIKDYKYYHISENEFKTILVAIEKHSTHPLAQSIVNYFDDVASLSIQTKEIPGMGVSATVDNNEYLVGRFEAQMCKQCEFDLNQAKEEGSSVVQIAKNKQMVGFVVFEDTLRKDAKDVINALNKRNIKTHLLTGDNYQTAQQISKELNFSSFKSDCLPHEKVEEVERLKQTNTVMMVGDGVNDAPALVASDVGVAMGSATDVSLEAADIVFVNNKLCHVDFLIKQSKRMHYIILQNLIFSLLVIFLLLIVNLVKGINITLGVLSHEGSTILVILNSLRLLIRKR